MWTLNPKPYTTTSTSKPRAFHISKLNSQALGMPHRRPIPSYTGLAQGPQQVEESFESYFTIARRACYCKVQYSGPYVFLHQMLFCNYILNPRPSAMPEVPSPNCEGFSIKKRYYSFFFWGGGGFCTLYVQNIRHASPENCNTMTHFRANADMLDRDMEPFASRCMRLMGGRPRSWFRVQGFSF